MEIGIMDEALSKKQLEYIIKDNPDGIIIFDQDGRTILTNSATEKLLGIPRSEIIGRYYNDPVWVMTTVDGKPFPKEEHPFTRALQMGTPVYGIEYAIGHRNGDRIIDDMALLSVSLENG
jgi:PAS domain S-box-containing protein